MMERRTDAVISNRFQDTTVNNVMNHPSSCNNHEIILTNFKNNEAITYSHVLLKGYIKNCCHEKVITIVNNNSDGNPLETEFKVSSFTYEFKALIELQLNINNLTIKYCNVILTLQLNYISETSEYKVKCYYIICKGHNGHFQSIYPDNVNNSPEIACKKLTLGIQLIRCLIAEKLFEHNFERKTFQFVSNCEIFHSKLSIDEARQFDQYQLWDYFAKEIISTTTDSDDDVVSDNSLRFKFITFLSFTKYFGITDNNYSYENIKLKTVGNAALGGGGLMIFGTGCLYTWPDNLQDVIPCFECDQPIDMRIQLDDSNYRRTYGGCFATTLGSGELKFNSEVEDQINVHIKCLCCLWCFMMEMLISI